VSPPSRADGRSGKVGADRQISLLYLIKDLELIVRSQLEQVTSLAKLTVIQYTALTALERHPGISSAHLARNSFVRAQTMAEMVVGLIDRGLIARERDPDNRRRYQLHLTAEGTKLVEALRPLVRNIEQLMVADLDQAEAEELRSYLESCRRSLMSTEPGPKRPAATKRSES
jgi:DNA-binding MarR family transcriptional regulator